MCIQGCRFNSSCQMAELAELPEPTIQVTVPDVAVMSE